MKTFFKVFFISFCIFTLVLSGVIYGIFKEPKEIALEAVMPDNEIQIVDSSPGDEDNKSGNQPVVKELTELDKLVQSSDRVNVLIIGLEETRTDTLIVASFNPKTKRTDLLSIPRDTYNETAGYDAADQKKINAVYGRKNVGGPTGVMQAVANILNVPIHYYVTVKYEGAADIIDTLGGVEVNIPFDMDYEDPWDDPPLIIKFDKGRKLLTGEEAVRYLRFRKNSDGTHNDGDIARIKRQKSFIKAAIQKALSFKLPALIRTTFDYVKTNMTFKEMGYYARCAVGISPDSIQTYTLPGKAKGISYYVHDPVLVNDLMIQIYNN